MPTPQERLRDANLQLFIRRRAANDAIQAAQRKKAEADREKAEALNGVVQAQLDVSNIEREIANAELQSIIDQIEGTQTTEPNP
jgi:hypothetical protein